jgi:hypothetical protein
MLLARWVKHILDACQGVRLGRSIRTFRIGLPGGTYASSRPMTHRTHWAWEGVWWLPRCGASREVGGDDARD